MSKPSTTPLRIARGGFVTVAAGSRLHREVRCDAGTLWITQDNDIRDVVLSAGERFVSDRPGTVVVYALEPAVVGLSPAAAAQASPLASLGARVLRALLPQRLAMS